MKITIMKIKSFIALPLLLIAFAAGLNSCSDSLGLSPDVKMTPEYDAANLIIGSWSWIVTFSQTNLERRYAFFDNEALLVFYNDEDYEDIRLSKVYGFGKYTLKWDNKSLYFHSPGWMLSLSSYVEMHSDFAGGKNIRKVEFIGRDTLHLISPDPSLLTSVYVRKK